MRSSSSKSKISDRSGENDRALDQWMDSTPAKRQKIDPDRARVEEEPDIIDLTTPAERADPPIRSVLLKPRLREVREMLEMKQRAKEKRRLLKGMDILKLAENPMLYCKKTNLENLADTEGVDPEGVMRLPKCSQTKFSLRSALHLVYTPLTIDPMDVQSYLVLLKIDRQIAQFLKMDYCLRISDKWLLALVYVYYQRIIQNKTQDFGKYQILKFTRDMFFSLLYLAIEAEEDQDEHKHEILPWVIGRAFKIKAEREKFHATKDYLLFRLNYRLLVARHVLEEVMRVNPKDPAWQRERQSWHSGAYRRAEEDDLLSAPYKNQLCYPRGPEKYPVWCELCFAYWAHKDESFLPDEAWRLYYFLQSIEGRRDMG